MNTLIMRYWCAPMFTYGAIRGYRTELSHPPLLSDTLCHSLMNGCVYVIPPFGVMKLIHTVDRFEIKTRQLDPNVYPSVYMEGRGINRHLFL